MGNFECNTIEDLLFNSSFRNWVISKSAPEADFWNGWVQQNPDKLELVNHSKAIIYAMHINFQTLTEEQINEEILRVMARLNEEAFDPDNVTADKKQNPFFGYKRFAKIAVVPMVMLICFGIYHFKNSNSSDAYHAFVSETKNTVEEKTSNTDSLLTVQLPDGSKVFLKHNSRISYSKDFSGDKREVFLTGEAFFEVAKNPAKPFFVYTSSVITKVLGTSFLVSAYDASNKAIITVKTGKVSVFRRDNFSSTDSKSKELGGLVVTPNQEVIYSAARNELKKVLVTQPVLVLHPKPDQFVFDATPISKVFKAMEDAYSIPIVYDEDVLSSCSLSASMEEGSFYDKLDLICKAIGASYDIIDGNIIITSKGCK